MNTSLDIYALLHDTRRLIVLGLAIVACCAAVGVVVVLKGVTAPGTPISQQNCHQLAATERHLAAEDRRINDGHVLSASEIEQDRQNSADATALNDRVDALGGCPNEPSLQ
jgi:hypothetical protein